MECRADAVASAALRESSGRVRYGLRVMQGFWSSHAIRTASWQTLAWCGYAVIPLLLPLGTVKTDIALDAGLVFALGLLMALRMNRAYERWWEGRTLWGTLVNASRNLAVKIRIYARPDPDESLRMHELIAGFAFGLRDHLRGGANLARLDGFSDEDGNPGHVPSELMVRMHRVFRGWAEAGRVTQEQLRMLDSEARIFLEVAGACERIHNTVLPPALTLVTRMALAASLLGVPWLLRDELGWLLIPIAGVASFLVLVSETIATALEHPFGTEMNQLDLTGIATAIESSTAETLGVERATA
jgi:putative membrane protein